MPSTKGSPCLRWRPYKALEDYLYVPGEGYFLQGPVKAHLQHPAWNLYRKG